MTIKKTKLNYKSAVSKTPPAGKIVVSVNHLEALDNAVLKKVKQNEAEREASIEKAAKYMVY